ncbi:MAG TPA: thioredoxin domain-containing protein [Flavobacteriaceae bacterium]|nr:thioredoxin domain-containing protein [Flavobacteriaceae bacterium]
MSEKYTNSLIHETSPYLLQHAHNPVAWKPWNDKTLQKAQQENKLLLISIGYAACHWCHVMEHECFEDLEVAEVMNTNFINVKVDREERPDVDQVYMNAVQLLTGRGGWPLNCIALPNGKPIWGGTYFPKEKWISALNQLAKLYAEKPEEIIDYAEKLTQGVQQSSIITFNKSEEFVSLNDVKKAILNWKPTMDFDFGGRKGAPKFPMPNNYILLLQFAFQTKNKEILKYINTSLTKMAYGGIFDHVGGGFSRYSVDAKWHVPHFEKMLYDNAQLVTLYSYAYQATKNALYKEAVYKTLDFIEEEFLDEEGGFYASLDADSLNAEDVLEEGAFYVWTKAELKTFLKDDYNVFAEYYNVNNYGFWEENKYVLIKNSSKSEFVEKHNLKEEVFDEKLNQWQKILASNRIKRNKPQLDDKIITSWNALMLSGYISAYEVFEEEKFLTSAIKTATFIYTKLIQPEGNLHRIYKQGKSSINAYLEDYAAVIEAYIKLYQVTFNEFWLIKAKTLTDYVLDHFLDLDSGMLFYTSNLDAPLISRKIEIEDNVIPASNSIMAINLFKLSRYFNNTYYLKVSKQMIKNVKETSLKYPSAYSNWLLLMLNYSTEFKEVAIVGKNALEERLKFNITYLPNLLFAGSNKPSEIPLLKNRYKTTKSLIYVCEEGACKLPVKTVEEAIELIN